MPLISYKVFQKIDRKTVQSKIAPVVVVFLIGSCLTLPSYLSLKRWQANLASTRESIRTAYRNIQQLPKLEEEEKRLGAEIANTRKELFTEDEVGSFVANVSELARSFGVQITSSRPQRLEEYIDPAFSNVYEAYEFRIDLEAEYKGLGLLLAELYHMPKIFKVDELSVVGRETKEDLNEATLSLVVISAREAGDANTKGVGSL